MASLVVTGSIGIDTIETPTDRAPDVLGGSASHFAVAASLYTDVGMVGTVGGDFPVDFRSFLEGRGVCLRGVDVVPEGETFRWHGRYHENLNHRSTLAVDLNVYEEYAPEVPASYRSPKVLFLANIDPETQAAVRDQVSGADLVAADTMELWIKTRQDEVRELLRGLDILFINEDEARLFADTDSLPDAGRRLLDWGPRIVVLKKGSHGAMLFREDEIFLAPADPHVRVVDPTGAGDSFAGGFLGYLAKEGWDHPDAFRRAVIHGSIAGGVNVAGFSCRAFEDFDADEIEGRYRRFQELTRF